MGNAMKKSLVDVEKAVRGIVVMSGPLEALGDSLVYGAIPAMWKAKSYPSFKPLAGYVTDLLERLNFLNEWLCEKPPSTYWISAFVFLREAAGIGRLRLRLLLRRGTVGQEAEEDLG